MYLEHSFYDVLSSYSPKEVEERLQQVTSTDVNNVLNKKEHLTIDDFLVLISNTALDYLEPMAKLSQEIKLQRFGKTINLYIPMYVSNECHNICTYCGYSMNNPQKRIVLNKEQILEEVNAIKKMGFEHVVILSGESSQTVNVNYFQDVMDWVINDFSHISLEVQPLEIEEYKLLNKKGLDGVYIYQETYHEKEYKKYHPKGKKSNFRYRLETPERVGLAGIRKIGLGALLGLENSDMEQFFLALHMDYLKKKFWKTKYSISFPRLKKASNVMEDFHFISDTKLTQYICAWRIFQPDVDIAISTRESSFLRDNLIPLGITSMSAESKTSPGGYSVFKKNKTLEQFEITDNRSIEKIKEAISNSGFESVFKDWDKLL